VSHVKSELVKERVGGVTGANVEQATTDSNLVFQKVAVGEYDYTFSTKAPAGFDKTATHTIGAYARRDLSEFDLGTYSDDATYNFVPDGSPVKTTRDVVRTISCNRCHQKLTAHGTGGRQSVEVCVLCHTPQSTDNTTEGTVDFKVMIHKIHMGADLPSVQAGGAYKVGRADFSTVEFPADVRRCTVCHAQDVGAAQQDAYLKPSRASCGACHDDVNFATGKNHPTIETSDNQCASCHIPQGELEFDVSIKGAHTIPTFSSMLPGVVIELLKVDGAAPGQKPTITFSLKNKAGTPHPAVFPEQTEIQPGRPHN
jgi:OmcA/MtrC family decaheme c-type cytochrome